MFISNLAMINAAALTVLQLDGFIMRSLQPSDLDVLAAIWSDLQVTRFLPSQGVPIPTEKVEKSLRSKSWSDRHFNYFALFHILKYLL